MSTYYDGPTYGIRDMQQAAPADVCSECHGELYEGETAYLWDGETLCEDCFKSRVLALLRTSPGMIAHIFGASTCIVRKVDF